MDTSETYVKMCEKAKEIQKGYDWSDGDWVYLQDWTGADWSPEKRPDGVHIISNGGCIEETYSNCCWDDGLMRLKDVEGNVVRLPRQDQLQEMMGDYEHNLSFIIDFGNEATHYDYKPDIQYYLGYGIDQSNRGWNFTSMEQLWLAFVMERNYGKRWDGTDWVKEKD